MQTSLYWTWNRLTSVRLSVRSVSSAGFTLIELLVCFVVLIVLLAFAFPALSKAREKSNDAKCVTNLRMLGVAMSLYVQDNDGKFPAPSGTPSFYDSIYRLVIELNPYVVGSDQIRYNWGNLNPNSVQVWRCPADVFGDSRGFEAAWHGSSYNFEWQYRGQFAYSDPLVSNMQSSMPDWEYLVPPRGASEARLMWDQFKEYHDTTQNILYADGHVESGVR